MHQRLLQLHVGFVMHAGQESKVLDHEGALAALTRAHELAPHVSSVALLLD